MSEHASSPGVPATTGPATAAGLERHGGVVEVHDAFNVWRRAIAVSGIEGTHVDGKKVHDFPVIWVVVLTKLNVRRIVNDQTPERIPWPVEDVRIVEMVPDDPDLLHRLIAEAEAAQSDDARTAPQ